MFDGAIAIACSGTLLPPPAGLSAFVADVGLLSVLQSSQFDFEEAYLAYRCSRKMYWEDEDSVG